ncbi:MAG: respiratory nitrate reductase subunit gamma [Thiobacillaceae bacterium]|nr:respiratory nitrate reductase subunit gamma [Thiobacillaceae bacterium]MCX7672138.1 respiratory nitrate reductase subunit gamma [Thiobacillaceae bacterium]
MNALEFLAWVRGPGLDLALAVFALGVVWRLIEIYTLGRKPDLAPPRRVPAASGWHTLWRRMLPPPGMFRRSPVSYVGGYVFHLGLAIVVFFFIPHIQLIKALLGLSWPGLPSPVIDAVTVVTLAAMVVVLIDRVRRPVKRYLSTFEDYFVWVLTFLPVLTGYLAVKHLWLPYTTMLALHILSAELLIALLPFTKLFHAFTAWGSRWFNGEINARRGVPV